MEDFQNITIKTEKETKYNQYLKREVTTEYHSVTYQVGDSKYEMPICAEMLEGFTTEQRYETIERTGWDSHYSTTRTEERPKEIYELTQEELEELVVLNHDEDFIISEETAKEMWEELLTIKAA